jgi:hypothetical protein
VSFKTKSYHILNELKAHIPFTLSGAVLGVIFMLVFRNAPHSVNAAFFKFSHPLHVILSAIVTASMLRLHGKYKNILFIIIIGWFGSIGLATLSDIIIPHYLGTKILNVNVPVHSVLHELEHADSDLASHPNEDEHLDNKIHLSFIEDWYIVNPAAFLGIVIAMFWPRTKIPHAGHILVSTWASSAYILMTTSGHIGLAMAAAMIIVLFIAVWFPCCLGDIIFPSLFAEDDAQCIHCHHMCHHNHSEGKDE